ncbi:hypothetical protein [Bifidobacterium sp. ESL0764]|uniref:hypothetical protein n=1 Tax=Bifidobacterium sp. ESL0764 TaxID=2983228 RepID=UPI0023F87937|nr:hypothetical protein [Bifidobacterium sp. ESL0764]WEV65619.1 hypothetical protein OZX71_07695 [Bifidobacterium sp. ESL0764]
MEYLKSHKTTSVIVAVVVIALVAVGAFFGVRADRGAALADCRESAAGVTAAYKAHRAGATKGGQLARDAVKPGHLTDRKLLKTVQQDNSRAGKAPKAVACPAGAPAKTLRQDTLDNRDLAAEYTGDKDAAAHRKALEQDMDKTTHKTLDTDLRKAEQLYKQSEGKVADENTRAQLKKAIDHAKAVSKDPTAK